MFLCPDWRQGITFNYFYQVDSVWRLQDCYFVCLKTYAIHSFFSKLAYNVIFHNVAPLHKQRALETPEKNTIGFCILDAILSLDIFHFGCKKQKIHFYDSTFVQVLIIIKHVSLWPTLQGLWLLDMDAGKLENSCFQNSHEVNILVFTLWQEL